MPVPVPQPEEVLPKVMTKINFMYISEKQWLGKYWMTTKSVT